MAVDAEGLREVGCGATGEGRAEGAVDLSEHAGENDEGFLELVGVSGSAVDVRVGGLIRWSS